MKDCNFYSKLYNELLKRYRINPDKYEREDAFLSAVFNIEDGKDEKTAFTEVFKSVHNIELSDMIFNSAYAVVLGFRRKATCY
jgi:CRISPR/Cas system endoribonuclease Cas6 (RAMP superfamily)